MNRIPRRIFSAEFKREAVHLITKQGLTLAEASRKLDVATKSLRTWMAQFERGELKAGSTQSCGLAMLQLQPFAYRVLQRWRLSNGQSINRNGSQRKYYK